MQLCNYAKNNPYIVAYAKKKSISFRKKYFLKEYFRNSSRSLNGQARSGIIFQLFSDMGSSATYG